MPNIHSFFYISTQAMIYQICSIVVTSLAASAGLAQGLIVDNFSAGDFNTTGTVGDVFDQTQTGSTDDIVGGSRGMSITPGSPFVAAIANGYFTVETAAPGPQVQITWGLSNPLGLNLAGVTDGGFVVNVYQGFTSFSDFQFEVFTDSAHVSLSPIVTFSHDGSFFFPFSGFATFGPAPADFSNINEIQFLGVLRPEPGRTAFLSIDSIVVGAVPEPQEWAVAGALGLAGFAGWRRWQWSRRGTRSGPV